MHDERLAAYLAATDYDDARGLVRTTAPGSRFFSGLAQGDRVHETRGSLDYALALLASGQRERAQRVLRAVLALQDTVPTSATFGVWPWFAEEPLSAVPAPDLNWADFLGARLAHIARDFAGALPADLLGAVRAALGHAAWAIFRRNVGPAYSNIAVMGAAVAAAAGEILAEPRLAAYGRQRLADIVAHVAFHGGFTEANSPTYTIVVLMECERLLALVADPAAQAQAEELRQAVWQEIAEHFHPGTGQWAGPHCRAYSDRLNADTAGHLSAALGSELPLHPAMRGGAGGWSYVPALPCPERWRGRFTAAPTGESVLRRRVIRLDPDEESQRETLWFAPDACLGSINHEDCWQQRRTLIGYWRTPEDPAVVLRQRFLHDGVDFSSAAVRNVQDGPRVLSQFGLFSDLGDQHAHLDRPADGVFRASDFRVRIELSGAGVSARRLDGTRFALAAGGRRVVVHVARSRFGDAPVTWEQGGEDGRVFVDGVCHRGAVRAFDLAAIGDVAIACGLELLPAGEAATDAPIALAADAERSLASWPLGAGLASAMPLRPIPYPYYQGATIRAKPARAAAAAG